MLGNIFFHNYYTKLLSASANAQLGTGTDLPATFWDVSPYERVHILCVLGTVDNSDTPKLAIRESDSTAGSLDTVASTLTFTAAGTDDNKAIMWTIEVSSLSTDHHFLAVEVLSGCTNGSYATVIGFGESKDVPETGDTTFMPADHRMYLAGGQAVADS